MKQKRRERVLKVIKQEENKQKELEYLKIKEWEEKFDREQKAKEQRENLKCTVMEIFIPRLLAEDSNLRL